MPYRNLSPVGVTRRRTGSGPTHPRAFSPALHLNRLAPGGTWWPDGYRWRAVAAFAGYVDGSKMALCQNEVVAGGPAAVTWTQATTGSQPTWVHRSTALNGRAALRCASTGNGLTGTLPSTLAQPFSMVFVGRWATDPAADKEIGRKSDGGVILRYESAPATFEVRAGATLTGPSWTPTTLVIGSAYINGANSRVRLNAAATTGNAGTNGLNNWRIGTNAATLRVGFLHIGAGNVFNSTRVSASTKAWDRFNGWARDWWSIY